MKKPISKAHAFWVTKVGQGSIETENLESASTGWCEVETLFSAISPGTEKLIFRGHVPETVYKEMRCPYMGGTFPAPVKYGYSLVGRVTEGPKKLLDGIVHILHPHQDMCVVRMGDVYIVPDDVPPSRATLASNMETAVNAIWDSQITDEEKALVVGFGIIGSLVSRVLIDMVKVAVDVLDTDPIKVRLAEKIGFSTILTEDALGQYDVAFHASGTGVGLQTAIDSLRFEGRVIELSWYGDQSVTLQLGGSFHSQRKRIISSQVSYLPKHLRSEWNQEKRKDLVFSLLKKELYDLHITHSTSFQQLPEVFQKFDNGYNGLAYLVEYQ